MFIINVALLYRTPSETVILYVKYTLIKVYASDFTKGLNILKRHFIMLMAVVYILLMFSILCFKLSQRYMTQS